MNGRKISLHTYKFTAALLLSLAVLIVASTALAPVEAATQDNVPYIDPGADGIQYADNVTVLDSSAAITGLPTAGILTSGWYLMKYIYSYGGTLTVSGDVNLILENGCNVTISSSNNDNAGIRVGPGNSLTIYAQSKGTGEGALTAKGVVTTPSGGAGIGGNVYENAGSITINGGSITAYGGGGSAGIGGGYNGAGGDTVIAGGNVTAVGNGGNGANPWNTGGAGIGGGGNASGVGNTGGNITITGDANVTASVNGTSANGGAGIGGGGGSSEGGPAGTIIIDTTGTVTATGGSSLSDIRNGADIGSGGSPLGNGTPAFSMCTVYFNATHAGAATGAAVSAIYNGQPVSSGASIRGGMALFLTATGMGADVYDYAWAGTGTSGQTSPSIKIILSSDVNATCTVTGWNYYEAEVELFLDDIAWDSQKVEITPDGSTFILLNDNNDGTYTEDVLPGTYDIYVNDENTSTTLTITYAPDSARVDHYTLSFTATSAGDAVSASVSASTGISSGDPVLKGSSITLTASGAGATGGYTYLWSDSSTAATLSVTVNATTIVSCTVTGWNIYAATVTVNLDGAVWNDGSEPTVTLWDGATEKANGSSLPNGTYGIYADGADILRVITINNAPASAALDYYSVYFSVSDDPAGTSAGSGITTAIYGAAGISSGDIVLGGDSLEITAAGAGATGGYSYAWTGSGTASPHAGGQATSVLTIAALGEAVDALCTVTGWNIYAATVTVNLDGAVWNDGSEPTVTLWDGATEKANGSSLPNGTYGIYADGADILRVITINNAPASAALDYFTVCFSVIDDPAGTSAGSGITTAIYGAAGISSGDIVLGGDSLEITAAGAGATGGYSYAWTGSGTAAPHASGQATSVLTISTLGETVDALCTVTGTDIIIPVKQYYITASADERTSISPSGTVIVSKGERITFVFSAADGKVVSAVSVDGRPLSQAEIGKGSYTFSDVNSNHSIQVSGREARTDLTLRIDVKEGKGYAEYSVNGGPFAKYTKAVSVAENANVTVIAYAESGEFKEWRNGSIVHADPQMTVTNVAGPLQLELYFASEGGSGSNTLLYVAAAIGIILIVGIAAAVFLRKPK